MNGTCLWKLVNVYNEGKNKHPLSIVRCVKGRKCEKNNMFYEQHERIKHAATNRCILPRSKLSSILHFYHLSTTLFIYSVRPILLSVETLR